MSIIKLVSLLSHTLEKMFFTSSFKYGSLFTLLIARLRKIKNYINVMKKNFHKEFVMAKKYGEDFENS